MSIVSKLDEVIASLVAVRADADKFDRGMTSSPGTRIRKATIAVQKELRSLRDSVLDVRKASKTGDESAEA